VTAVRCLYCGARFDTDLPASAVERIRRCAECGRLSLEPVPGERERDRGGRAPTALAPADQPSEVDAR
jgi:hypothetical protein